jgi:hypothetical protein
VSTFASEGEPDGAVIWWTRAVLLVSTPVLATLFHTLWRTPFPVSEAVALFEDIAKLPPSSFVVPETSYYRPLFQLSLMAIWHTASSIEFRLTAVRLLHVVPAACLVLLFISHLRPRIRIDAAMAAVAVAVLVGSPGFRDNLELPLAYTAVGMPLALGAWILLNREPRP